ncbi:MFS transporter [Vallitalea okinawensis]|uniref:MFS transporter n=1 Tax=Vallitalea okinawensis TaxID=2078660 RepID=UPI0013004207|nr:MFS transporter [Vallitalea okinawensis]
MRKFKYYKGGNKVNNKHLKKNIVIYYLYLGFGVRLIAPIVVLFLLDKGISFTQIMMLQSINAVSIVLLEVPTGAIADLVGRKFSLMISSIMLIIGLIIYVVTRNFYLFILAEIMFGLGLSFKSGADSALLYDTLKELKREEEFSSIQGKALFYALLLQSVGSIIIGYLYNINVNLPYIVSIGLLTISGVFTIFFTETHAQIGEEKSNYYKHVKSSAAYVMKHHKIRAIIMYSVFIYIIWRIGFWYYQPYMKAVYIDAKYFGILFSIFNLAAAIGSRNANVIMKRLKNKSLLFLASLFISSFLMMGMTRLYIGAFFILFQEFARGIRRPLLLKYVNDNIPTDKRATIISFKSLCENLTVAVLYPLIGVLMDQIDIVNLHLYTGIIALVGTIGLYKYLLKELQSSKSNNNNASYLEL